MFIHHHMLALLAVVLLSAGAWSAPLGGNDLTPLSPLSSNRWASPGAGAGATAAPANRDAAPPRIAFRGNAHDAALAAAAVAAAASAGAVKLSFRGEPPAPTAGPAAAYTTAATGRRRNPPSAYRRMLQTLVCQRGSHPKLCDDMLALRVTPVANSRKGPASKEPNSEDGVESPGGRRADAVQDSNVQTQRRTKKRKNSHRETTKKKILKKVDGIISNTNEILRQNIPKPIRGLEHVQELTPRTAVVANVEIQEKPDGNLRVSWDNLEQQGSPTEIGSSNDGTMSPQVQRNSLAREGSLQNYVTASSVAIALSNRAAEKSSAEDHEMNEKHNKENNLLKNSDNQISEIFNHISTTEVGIVQVTDPNSDIPNPPTSRKPPASEGTEDVRTRTSVSERTSDGSLPDGYRLVTGVGVYKLHEQRRTWPAARAVCEREGGHLVVINSELEAEALRALMREHSPYLKYVLVGFHDVSREGHYVTLTGKTLKDAGYEKWKANEPNGYGGNEDCGSMNPEAEYNDIFCDRQWQFICEIEIVQ